MVRRILVILVLFALFEALAGRRVDKKEAKEIEKRAEADRKAAEKREQDKLEAEKKAAELAAAIAAAEEEEASVFVSRYAAALGPIDLATAALRPPAERFGLPAPIWPALLDHGNVGSDVPAGSLPCNET